MDELETLWAELHRRDAAQLVCRPELQPKIICRRSAYIKATCDYAAEVSGLSDARRTVLNQTAAAAFDAQFGDHATAGAALWLLDPIRTETLMSSRVSKVGVARRYVEELRTFDATPRVSQYRRARDLANWIRSALDLPAPTLPQSGIVEESS